MKGQGRGWVTAEYNMLPGSTSPRKSRDRGGKIDGRTTEIQRLIGRSLRAVIDLAALGERSITIDCDVLEADGGTRTASITGALIALVDAVRTHQRCCSILKPRSRRCATAWRPVSVGHRRRQAGARSRLSRRLRAASVDMNVVSDRPSGQFVEVQGTGEEATFDEQQLAAMLKLARARGIEELCGQASGRALGRHWPFG